MSEENIIICGPRGNYPDDIYGECDECEADIVWRSHSPKGKHVCLRCAAAMISGCTSPPQFVITEQTVRELYELNRKKLN